MNNKWKWISIGTVGSLFALSHIGMIGMIARKSSLPQLNMPVGEYTSYKVEASKDGYRVEYRANDPKVMHVERDIKKKGGFLGLGNNTTTIRQQYTMDGSVHLDGGGVNPIASTKSEACIEAIGGGKQTGRLVGGSVGASVATTGVASIPYVGWVLAGAATMMGMDAGSDVGGSMAESLSGACQEE